MKKFLPLLFLAALSATAFAQTTQISNGTQACGVTHWNCHISLAQGGTMWIDTNPNTRSNWVLFNTPEVNGISSSLVTGTVATSQTESAYVLTFSGTDSVTGKPYSGNYTLYYHTYCGGYGRTYSCSYIMVDSGVGSLTE